MWRRHDLLRVDPCTWELLLGCRPSLAQLPLVADWARLERPVMVRRRLPGECEERVPVGLPLPPSCGKQRLCFSFPPEATVVALPPALLRDAAPVVPPAWQPVLDALLDLGESEGTAPRVFGALLWQHLTGLPYLTARSDLDVLWSISDEQAAFSLVQRLLRLDAKGPVRIDGELELPDGAAVNWRELAQSCAKSDAELLVKTMQGVETRRRSSLFRQALLPS
jgi:phosphoribosyl-dephospho-CoA transferase